MELNRALEVLGITDILNLERVDLKNRYRSMMKVNHPDIGGSDAASQLVIEAYAVVSEAVGKLEKYTESNKKNEILVLSLGELQTIYNGGCIRAAKGVGNVGKNGIDLAYINSTPIRVRLDVRIVVNGVEQSFTTVVLKNEMDVYGITCKIKVESVSKPTPVSILAYGKRINFNMGSSSINVTTVHEHNVKLNVTIERMVIDTSK